MTTDVVSFSVPSAEDVEHYLRELDFGQSLSGYKMTPSGGNAPVELYNLPAAVLFMLGTNWDAPMLSAGFKGTINWVDTHLLVEWLRSAVGDIELADRVEKQVLPLESYRAQMEMLSEVFSVRMKQYREVQAESSGDDV